MSNWTVFLFTFHHFSFVLVCFYFFFDPGSLLPRTRNRRKPIVCDVLIQWGGISITQGSDRTHMWYKEIRSQMGLANSHVPCGYHFSTYDTFSLIQRVVCVFCSLWGYGWHYSFFLEHLGSLYALTGGETSRVWILPSLYCNFTRGRSTVWRYVWAKYPVRGREAISKVLNGKLKLHIKGFY